MFIPCKLAAVTLIIGLTLDDGVHAESIIGGHEAQEHSRPYMVLLERELAVGCTKHCSGFLLNEHFVMTAAHCQAKSYKVFLGLHDYNDQNGVQHLSVSREFPHNNYSTCCYVNDIMLLKLSSKAMINDNVKPIALSDQTGASLPQSCSVAGWGRTEKSSSMSAKLLETSVTLIEHKKCVERNTYCSADNAGPGSGDSGSPLVCEDGRAYGVVTLDYRAPCAAPIFMYTKIADNRAWIDEVLKHGEKL